MGIIFGSTLGSSSTEYSDVIHNELHIKDYLLDEVNSGDHIGVNNTPMIVISDVGEANNVHYGYDGYIKVENYHGTEFQLVFDETLTNREPAVYDPRLKSIKSRINRIRPKVLEIIKYEFV